MSKKLAINGPEIWSVLYPAVNKVYGQSIIAGGSPRDWIVNKQIRPKDIDFFVPVENELDLELGIFELEENFDNLRLLRSPESYGGKLERNEAGSNNIVGVLEGSVSLTSKNGQEDTLIINIIGKSPEKIENPSLLVKDFDHSLCRTWVNPDTMETVVTPEMQKTLDTGVITLYNMHRRNIERVEKMLSKGKSYSGRFSYVKPSDQPKQPPFSLDDFILKMTKYDGAPIRGRSLFDDNF